MTYGSPNLNTYYRLHDAGLDVNLNNPMHSQMMLDMQNDYLGNTILQHGTPTQVREYIQQRHLPYG